MVRKNRDKFQINTIDIKSHLDASLDIDNIKVSEELIAKTLLAIKASENEKTIWTDSIPEEFMDPKENSNKVDKVINIEKKMGKIRFFPMKIATVAAAFIFVVGIYAMSNVGKKDSNRENSSMEESKRSMDSDNVTYDRVETDNSIVDGAYVTEDKSEEYGIESSKSNENYKQNSIVEPEVGITEDFNIAALVEEPSTISNLYPTQNYTIGEFIIKDANNELISSTKQIENVKKVYEILDEYPLTRGENKALEYTYQFDILTDDGQSTTILIGSGIYVKTSDELEYTYYEVNNSDELLVKLENFISIMP